MKPQRTDPDIYQLRIVLRDISPLIWRRLLVQSDTTLAQLHLMLQLCFEWSNEHLYRFRVYGKDFGHNNADTQHVRLNTFGLHQGERFRYFYNFIARWQCDIRLEATLPFDPKQVYPVCTGGKRPAPPEYVPDAWAYLELLDAHRYPPFEAILTLADMAQAMLNAPPGVSIREAVGDLDTIRDAKARLETYDQFQPSAFKRRRLNAELRQQTWTENRPHEIQGAGSHPER
jgi:Plasmid pRiA4b ORF-3-like protein